MPTIILSIGATPAEEACAQLGVTRGYEKYGFIEAMVYRAALVAKFGPPPPGVSLRVEGANHDFGRYYEVRAIFDAEAPSAEPYVERIENGLGRWIEAGFVEPIRYDQASQVVEAASCPFGVVTRVILTLERQRIAGYGSLEEAEMIANLRTAYPVQAQDADQLLRQIATETEVRAPCDRRVGLYAPYRLIFMPELFHRHRSPRTPEGDVIDIEARELRTARVGHRFIMVDLGSVATLDQAIETCWEHYARYVIA